MSCSFNGQAWAQQTSIAIVDMEKILSDSLAGKSIQAQLTEKREAFQREFSEKENQLLQVESILIDEKTSLTPEAFEVKRKGFELKLLETRNLFQKRRNELDKGLNKALGTLKEEVMSITANIAEKKGYSLVLTRDSVVIVDKNLDITEIVLEQMNANMKSIPLNLVQ